MPKLITRIVAVLVIPSLIGDPAYSAIVAISSSYATTRGASIVKVFISQALAMPVNTTVSNTLGESHIKAGEFRAAVIADRKMQSWQSWLPNLEQDLKFWGAGSSLVMAGLILRQDLAWGAGTMIGIGVLLILVGRPIFRRIKAAWRNRMEAATGDEDPAVQAGLKTPEERRADMRYFWKGVFWMGALAAFCWWRVTVTAWRRTGKYYPFDHWPFHSMDHLFGGALRIIDHSWVNDFLTTPAFMAGMFLVIMLGYSILDNYHKGTESLFGSATPNPRDTSYADRERLMKNILYTAVFLIFEAAWREEIGLAQSIFIFDKFDVLVIGAGLVVAIWIIQILPYPNFAKTPPFSPFHSEPVDKKAMKLKAAIDGGAIFFAWLFTYLLDFTIYPPARTPFTPAERYVLPIELTFVFFAVREVIQWHMRRSSDFIFLGNLTRPGPTLAERAA